MTTWRHGGDIWHLSKELKCPPEGILDFSSSLNPFGPPQWLLSLVEKNLPYMRYYPDPWSTGLCKAIGESYGSSIQEILIGNGSSQLLYLIPWALLPHRAVIPAPSYVDYEYGARASRIPVHHIIMDPEKDFELPVDQLMSCVADKDIVFLARPNNPTGSLYEADQIRWLAKKKQGAFFVVDQAFYHFVDDKDPLLVNRPANIALVFSLTKAFAVPGIRLGWVIADPWVVEKVRNVQSPWSVNFFAQIIGEAALKDGGFVEDTRRRLKEQRELLFREINRIDGFLVYPSKANFLLVRINRQGPTAQDLRKQLLGKRIAIRTCENFVGLDEGFFRICVRTDEENIQLIDALKEISGVWTDP